MSMATPANIPDSFAGEVQRSLLQMLFAIQYAARRDSSGEAFPIDASSAVNDLAAPSADAAWSEGSVEKLGIRYPPYSMAPLKCSDSGSGDFDFEASFMAL